MITLKNLELTLKAMRFMKKGYRPEHMGSGSTGVAAVSNGRSFISV